MDFIEDHKSVPPPQILKNKQDNNNWHAFHCGVCVCTLVCTCLHIYYMCVFVLCIFTKYSTQSVIQQVYNVCDPADGLFIW